MQILIGIVLFAAGIAGMLRLVPALIDVAYPLVWWGLLSVVDAWNFGRRGLSLWRADAPRFFAVTAPVSALLWILFELLNLPSPEWIYRGGFHSIPAQTVLGFLSFATVIPIVIEAWWLVRGGICFTAPLLAAARRWRAVFLIFGLGAVVLPFFNHLWHVNQAMWIAPALLLLPFTKSEPCTHSRRWLIHLAIAGLLSGFMWESLNYLSPVHWEYRILPRAPHLFRMPLPGYIGFIPLALTCLAVYDASRRIPVKVAAASLLYALALGSMFVVTRICYERGIWRP